MEGFLFSNPTIISPVDMEPGMGFVDEMIEGTVSGGLFTSENESVREPCEGMEFESEEAARQFYNAYAAQTGFKARVSSFIRSKRDKTIISRQLVCSREGFRSTKDATGEGRAKRPRMITRVGCRAMIMVKKQSSGEWVISKCENIHNHELGTQGNVVMLPYDPYAHDDQEMIEYSTGGESDLHGGVVSDPHEILVVPPVGDPELEPQEGMQFESEQDAQKFYKEYARRVGFRARVSSYYRSKRDNSIISRLIVCSKEGFRAKRDESLEDKLQRPRAVTRIGCKAMVMVKKRISGKWVVSKLVKSHNHMLTVRTASDDESSEAEDSEDFEKSLISHDGGSVTEPYEGMEFESEEAARLFYFAYSRRAGFDMRVSTYYRSKRDKSIISRLFVCCKEGFYVKKNTDNEGKIKRPREATRVGCKAMLMVKKVNSGRWVVSKFEKQHNHSLGSVRKSGKLRKRKWLYSKTKVPKNQMEPYHDGQESPITRCCNHHHETIRFAEAGAAMHALQEAVEKVSALKRNSGGCDLENNNNQYSQLEFCPPLDQQPGTNSHHLDFHDNLESVRPRTLEMCNHCERPHAHNNLESERPRTLEMCNHCEEPNSRTSWNCPTRQVNMDPYEQIKSVADEPIS